MVDVSGDVLTYRLAGPTHILPADKGTCHPVLTVISRLSLSSAIAHMHRTRTRTLPTTVTQVVADAGVCDQSRSSVNTPSVGARESSYLSLPSIPQHPCPICRRPFHGVLNRTRIRRQPPGCRPSAVLRSLSLSLSPTIARGKPLSSLPSLPLRSSLLHIFDMGSGDCSMSVVSQDAYMHWSRRNASHECRSQSVTSEPTPPQSLKHDVRMRWNDVS